jgi:hypothetical protein
MAHVRQRVGSVRGGKYMWRHVPRVSWLDMPPPRGGLFWQFFLHAVFFDNPLVKAVFFVKNSRNESPRPQSTSFATWDNLVHACQLTFVLISAWMPTTPFFLVLPFFLVQAT